MRCMTLGQALGWKDLIQFENGVVLLNIGGDEHHRSRKLPKCHRLRTGTRNGNKSVKSMPEDH